MLDFLNNMVTPGNFFWFVFAGAVVVVGGLGSMLVRYFMKKYTDPNIVDPNTGEVGQILFIAACSSFGVLFALIFANAVDGSFVDRSGVHDPFSLETSSSQLALLDEDGVVQKVLPVGAIVWDSEGYVAVPVQDESMVIRLDGYDAEGKAQRLTCWLEIQVTDFHALRAAKEQVAPPQFRGGPVERQDALRRFASGAARLVQKACAQAFPLKVPEAHPAWFLDVSAALSELEKQAHGGVRFTASYLPEHNRDFY